MRSTTSFFGFSYFANQASTSFAWRVFAIPAKGYRSSSDTTNATDMRLASAVTSQPSG